MSRLRELMEELCPNGVEYKQLGEIGTLVRGKRFVKNDFADIGVPAIHYGEMYTYYGISSSEAKTKIRAEISSKMRYAQTNDVIIVGAGETVEDIGIGVAWLGKDDVAVHDACYIFRHNMNPIYVSYLLRTESYHKLIKKYITTGKISSISAQGLAKAIIPVPPLEIQNEIVKLLDSFTELTTELTAELTAELTLRKKQYNFYRDSLLNFVRVDDTIVQTDRQTDRQAQRISEFGLWRKTQHIEWKSLRDISVRISSGGTPRKTNSAYYTGGTIPWLRTQEVEFNYIEKATSFITEEGLKNSSAKWIPAHCVIVAISGATAGRSAVNNIPVTTNQHCCNIEVNEEMVEYKYVFYWVKSQYEKLKGLGRGARADLSAEIIANYPIPVPPLSEQCRIVSILDRFDALCNDLTSGLPAEIAARKKQYEHYRDRLLTFPRSNG